MRTKGNESDKDLEVVERTNILIMTEQHALATPVAAAQPKSRELQLQQQVTE